MAIVLLELCIAIWLEDFSLLFQGGTGCSDDCSGMSCESQGAMAIEGHVVPCEHSWALGIRLGGKMLVVRQKCWAGIHDIVMHCVLTCLFSEYCFYACF